MCLPALRGVTGASRRLHAGQWRTQAAQIWYKCSLAAIWESVSFCLPSVSCYYHHHHSLGSAVHWAALNVLHLLDRFPYGLSKVPSWSLGFFLLVKDLKVWRTDPGSIFDIDPLEDNIQSRSLHMLSGIVWVPLFLWVLSWKLLMMNYRLLCGQGAVWIWSWEFRKLKECTMSLQNNISYLWKQNLQWSLEINPTLVCPRFI